MTNKINNEANGRIGSSAFAGCKNLTEVKISNAITRLEDGAFLSCIELENIEIPKSVSSCGATGGGGVFKGCTNLKNVTFEEGSVKVPSLIFYNCVGPIEANLPESINVIENSAFWDSGITQITIPTNLKTINTNAFASCSSLSTVNYRGDATAWNKISIAGGNEAIKNITPIFNYSD